MMEERLGSPQQGSCRQGGSPADVNECRRPLERRVCHHSCHNTVGSFLCTCRPGFRLRADRVSCEGERLTPPLPPGPAPSSQAPPLKPGPAHLEPGHTHQRLTLLLVLFLSHLPNAFLSSSLPPPTFLSILNPFSFRCFPSPSVYPPNGKRQ